MKAYLYGREKLMMIIVAFAVVAFLAAYTIRASVNLFDYQNALLGVIAIAVTVLVFGKMERMKLVLFGLVVLSFTHISHVLGVYAGIEEYVNNVIEHSIFFIGMLLIMQGIFVLSKEQLAKK